MRIVFIDDNSDSRKQWMDWAKGKGYSSWVAESVFDAKDFAADFFVFDLSAVGDLMQPHSMYSPICKLIELHPGAGIILMSATSERAVRDVIDEVSIHFDSPRIEYGGWGTFEGVEKALKLLEERQKQ